MSEKHVVSAHIDLSALAARIDNMKSKREIQGQKFGRWFVVERAEKPAHLSQTRRESYWKVICDCGAERVVTASRLVGGRSKSCGCLALDLKKDNFRTPAEYVGVTHAFVDYRGRAKRTGKDFQLTREQFENIATKPCTYCGSSLENIMLPDSERGKFHYTGIDRVDSSKGYISENCVPCCRRCNLAKRNYELGEFKDWVARVYHHMFEEK